ncbi:MAG: lectin like domain-containing protein [Lachnospiraceae bacterium]|nr:lectin like domain-containing protein [Lachnospiraceae bacterium]
MQKKYAAVLLFLLLWVGVFGIRFTLTSEQVVAGGDTVEQLSGDDEEDEEDGNGDDYDSVWNRLIAQYVNEQEITLMVGGKTVAFDESAAYMNDSLEIMLPLDIFQDSFDCAVNIYDGTTILIERGDTSAELTVGSTQYRLNSATLTLQTPVVKVNDTIYIPLLAVRTIFSYTYSWDISQTLLSLETTAEETSMLPSYYNYSEMGKTTAAKNQGSDGNCWAFAALTAIETTLLPEENLLLSVEHLWLRPSFANASGNGGDYSMALAYLLSWEGPVLESEDPYGDGVRNESATVVKHVQEVQILESKNFEQIKQMIYQYGGVQSSIYMSLASADSESLYYNTDTYGYAYIGTENPNHDIVIVGWDDNYSAENFGIEVGGDGAFICRNSWGSDFGDEGNFYISYYDTNIGVHNVVYTGIEDADNYDNIYQSDLCGWTGNMGYSDEDAYMANVYTAGGDERIEAVGFYATAAGTEYTIYIARSYRNSGDLNNRVRAASGTLKNAGYYTIDLDLSLTVSAGEEFAVIVYIRTPGATMPIAIEYASEGSNLVIDVSDGEGYISSDGNHWENTEESRGVNLCLKAYTVDQ